MAELCDAGLHELTGRELVVKGVALCRLCHVGKRERQALANRAEQLAKAPTVRVWYEQLRSSLGTTLIRHTEAIPEPGTVPQAGSVQRWSADDGRWHDV